jgi:hypothetical protein
MKLIGQQLSQGKIQPLSRLGLKKNTLYSDHVSLRPDEAACLGTEWALYLADDQLGVECASGTAHY